MKITKQDLKKLIISEVKEMAKKEGWINDLKSINECDCGCGCEEQSTEEQSSEIAIISLTTPEEFETVSPEDTKEVEIENLSESVKPQEVKKLADELFRMKQLLGLKKPLLGEK